MDVKDSKCKMKKIVGWMKRSTPDIMRLSKKFQKSISTYNL